jgi:hypothetical protein
MFVDGVSYNRCVSTTSTRTTVATYGYIVRCLCHGSYYGVPGGKRRCHHNHRKKGLRKPKPRFSFRHVCDVVQKHAKANYDLLNGPAVCHLFQTEVRSPLRFNTYLSWPSNLGISARRTGIAWTGENGHLPPRA